MQQTKSGPLLEGANLPWFSLLGELDAGGLYGLPANLDR